jgi:uncharacterized protein (TIRG00374 family)
VDREHLAATVGGFLVAGLVFAVMFYVVDAEAVLAAGRQADLVLLAAAAGSILLWNVAWGLELWTVLRSLNVETPVHTAILVNAASGFANHVTPFGQAGGEPVTAWFITQSTGTDYEVGLASIASLDAINIVPSASFAAVGGVYFLSTTNVSLDLGVLPNGAVWVVAALAVVAVLAVVFRDRVSEHAGSAVFHVVHAVTTRVPRVTPPSREMVTRRVASFVAAIKRVGADRPRLATAVGLSALGWVFQAVGLWVTFLALGEHIPVYVPLFVLPLGTMGSVVPTPGGLGGTEAINVTVLTVVTSVAAPTIAAAVTLHSVGGYLLTTSLGAAAASVLGVRGAIEP